MPQVRWVHSLLAGVETLVQVSKDCEGINDVSVSNARGAFSEPLAEWCLATMLFFNKQIPRIQANQKTRNWERFGMNELRGQTVGFIGFGDIALTTAQLCRAFVMRVIACRRALGGYGDELADELYVFPLGRKTPDHRAVFEDSDFVVCLLPETPHTNNFCGAEEFAAMKDTGVFISLGRGTNVDEQALVEALQGDIIAGAALDVFQREPLPASSELWDCKNLLLNPHNAAHVPSAMGQAWGVYLKNFECFRNGQKFPTVSIEHGY